MFPSGSSSATNSAESILGVIFDVIGESSNFVRIRGYTDDQMINNEIFSSNWELSVARATAILRVLEKQGMTPARMAIEGYGQYYPTADNSTSQGRAKNRKVVVAISKYGLEKSNLLNTPAIKIEEVEAVTNEAISEEKENEIQVIRLPNGGIRISTRKENENMSENKN